MTRNPQRSLDLYHDAREAYVVTARMIAREICEKQGTVSADDLAERLPLPEGLAPQTVAAVFRKGFRQVDVQRSTRPERFGGYVGIYIATNGHGTG